MTPSEIIFSFVTAIVLAFGFVRHPTVAQCPQGWWLPEGVRRNGTFVCRPGIIGGDDDALTGRSTSYQPPEAISGAIYCTGGTEPIIVDERTVGCQRGGWKN